MLIELTNTLCRFLDDSGCGTGVFPTPIDGLVLIREYGESQPRHAIYHPALCLVAQGAKQVMLADEVFNYHAMQALVVSVELPILGRITKASGEEPYVAMIVQFDTGLMRDVLNQLISPPRPEERSGLGLFVQDVDGAVADCLLRLAKLLETPEAVPILHPAVMREIYYWLLTGPYGSEICKLALPNSHTQRITAATHILRRDFARPLRVEQLADAAGMSSSSFHQHFKAITAMSPLQYQKQLRLLEARRLMLSEGANASEAAFQVGYESPSQFSREYARMFGAPPRRNMTDLRAVPA